MKNTPIGLMTLLRLVNDQVETDERRQTEIAVRSDPDAFALMEKLRELSINNSDQLHVTSVHSTDRMDIDNSPQRIAAFIDGTLNEEESVLFENDCWSSQELLHDVTILYQASLQSKPEQLDGSERFDHSADERLLRQRLVDLMPELPSGSQHQKSKIAVPQPGAMKPSNVAKEELPTDVLIDNPIVNAKQKPVANRPIQSRGLSGRTLVIFAAAIVTIVVISTSVMLRPTPTPPTVDLKSLKKTEVQPEPIESHSSHGLAEDESAPTSTDKIVESNHRDEPLPHNSQPIGDGASPQNGPKDSLVESNDPKSTVTPGSMQTGPDELNDIRKNVSPSSLPWIWGRVEGLVAVRKPGSDVWSGALSENAPNEPAENGDLDCQVLPLSWAEANLRGVGQWIIAENTDFSIATTNVQQSEYDGPDSESSYRSQAIVKIDLRRGQFAISDANVGSTVLVRTARGNWTIRITKESTVVVVVEKNALSQVLVQSGSANVNRTKLKARQTLMRARDGQMQQTVDQKQIKWLRKPEKQFPDKRFANQWLETRDLFTELSKVDIVLDENQPRLRAAFATIDPPGQAARYLANVLPDVRAEGIQWLVAYGHDERQLRVLSSQMATELGFPGLKAVLPRLVIAINRKRWPPKADVEVLIAGLQHRNLPVRRFSHGLLVHLFGTLEVYDSESSASSRNQQARKWLAAINRLYRRLGNSRQR